MRLRGAATVLTVALGGCGAAVVHPATQHRSTTATVLPRSHPQAVEPVAGAAPRSPSPASSGAPIPLTDPVPVGPASNISAPAKGAPTDAQVRTALARFRAAVARYHLDRLNFSGVLLNFSQLPPGPYRVSIASVFTDYNKPIACGGVLHIPQLGVANKTLPCGTEVTFVYGRRAIRVPVIDRGPYVPGRKWDLTGATAEALHFPGLGQIAWRIG